MTLTTSENVGVLLNGSGDLMAKDRENTKPLDVCLPCSLLVRLAFRKLGHSDQRGSAEQRGLTLYGGWPGQKHAGQH